MDERKNNLLKHIVEDYIDTAQPVSSGQLVKSHQLDVSPATVRNDMMYLEQEGYIESPHTSAGRIPTAAGYAQYVRELSSNHIGSNVLTTKESNELAKAFQLNADRRLNTKNLAKSLAEISQTAVIAGFSKNDVYYTGLSYLFSQPEFQDLDMVYTIGEVVDHLDEQINEVFDSLSSDIDVLIGSENPFSHDCSFIGFSHEDNGTPMVFGILGPIRMSYSQNVERVRHVRELVTSN